MNRAARHIELVGVVVAGVVLTVAAGCGGATDSETRSSASGRRCSDFAYQEDAQAALRGGATQLDGDHDGIACESLPHRPIPSPAPVVTYSATGLWLGTTDGTRSTTQLVFPGGNYYLWYSVPSNPTVIGGLVYGTGTTSGSSFTSTSAKDFNVEGLGVRSASLVQSIATKQTLNGLLAHVSGPAWSVATSYSSRFTLTPTTSSLAGTYSGQLGLGDGFHSATVTVTSIGGVTGVIGGCSLTGTTVPRLDGNAFDITVTFGTAVCRLAGQTLTGIGYFDGSKSLYLGAPTAAQTEALVFLGVKP